MSLNQSKSLAVDGLKVEQVTENISKEFLMQWCSRHMKLGESIFICIVFVVDTALLTVNTFFLVQTRDQTPLLKSQTKASFSQTGTKLFGQFGQTVNTPNVRIIPSTFQRHVLGMFAHFGLKLALLFGTRTVLSWRSTSLIKLNNSCGGLDHVPFFRRKDDSQTPQGV